MGATTPARLTGDGDRLRILAHLAWPAIIEQILGTMVSYVDTGMVGVLGATSTAAVAINAASIWLVNGTLAGIGVGYSVQVANAIGAGDPEQARRVIRQAVLATAAAGLAVLAVFQLLASYIPVWLGAKPEVLPYAVEYLRFYSLGLPFAAAVSVFSSILRCMGDTKRPLLFNTAANLLNIVFNFFPHLRDSARLPAGPHCHHSRGRTGRGRRRYRLGHGPCSRRCPHFPRRL
ncbi:MAG: MATE family efflux transporter [Intestinimonas sp.]